MSGILVLAVAIGAVLAFCCGYVAGYIMGFAGACRAAERG